MLVGVARQSTVDRYARLFNEAGVAVSSFTFSAAAVHAAIRLNGHQDGGFVALSRAASGAVEVYGESASRPVFSAEFDVAPQRAATMALAELRLPPDTVPLQLDHVLPKPKVNPVANDLSVNARPYATALAGACPRLSPFANVLPAAYRRFNSRAVFIPTLILAFLLIAVAGGMLFYSRYAEQQSPPGAGRHRQAPAASLPRRLARSRNRGLRARARLIEQYRGQTRYDLDTLNELTRLVEPPAWTNNIDMARDTVHISGEAPQATTLVKILDSSPFFKNSNLDNFTRTPAGMDNFQIRANRGVR